MRTRTISGVCAAIMAACSCAPLSIVHFNDTHSHYEAERDGEYAGKGGVFERAIFVDSVRVARGEDHVLLLHDGDFSQGSVYFSQFGGAVETDVMNAMRYDCTTLGNHEFDNGLEDLTERVKKMNTPVVCANVDFSGMELENIVKPYTIIKRGGHKIGIIGLTANLATNVSKPIADKIKQLDNVTEVNRWSTYLRKTEHCDLVILLSHCGYREDEEIAPKLHGVNLIVGGHSHTFMKEMESLTDADGKTIYMIQNGCWGRKAGEILVY